MFSVRAPSCSELLSPRAFVPSFCTVPRVCATAPHQLGGFGMIWWISIRSHEFIDVYCEAIVSLLALFSTYDSYIFLWSDLITISAHVKWCPGVNIKCNLNAGSQKRDVDALRSAEGKVQQSSWRHPGEQVKSLWNCRFKVLGIHWGGSLSYFYLYIYIYVHYSTWWYMNNEQTELSSSNQLSMGQWDSFGSIRDHQDPSGSIRELFNIFYPLVN